MRPYTNPLMTTPEEVMTQRFYLRKIEGAEVLLAYETNFFRQELHKWAPVGPEPPPILQYSHSTRKPRPTKQQKMMAELGIDNPEHLPQKFRTKQHTFGKSRKSSDAHSTKAPQPLQPAPQFVKRSDTPLSLTHSTSTGNASSSHGHSHRIPQPISTAHANSPYSAYYSSMHSPQPHHTQQHYNDPSPTFAWQNRLPEHNPSPGFSHSPGFPPHSPLGRSGPPLDPGLFSPTNSHFASSALREVSGAAHQSMPHSSMTSPMRDHFGNSSNIPNMDNLFADYTIEVGDDNGRNEAGEALEEEIGLGIIDDAETERRLADEFLNH